MNQFSREPGRGTTFLDLPARYSDPRTSRAAILPVPYDETSSWKKGADRGPAAIIDASAYVEVFDTETFSEPYKKGIALLPAVEYSGPPDGLVREVESRVGAILDQKQLPIVLGGEHSVTIGAVEAARKRFDDLSVLQMDAHADTREEYHGSPFNHACVMARAREHCEIVQVGIRSLDTPEFELIDRERVFFAYDIAGAPDDSWVERAVSQLTDHVYVTIDLDAFDPSFFPATGTPEPGGLSWRQVNLLLRTVCRSRKVVGFDVVEMLPTPGLHHCEFTAAKLVYRFIAEVFAANHQ